MKIMQNDMISPVVTKIVLADQSLGKNEERSVQSIIMITLRQRIPHSHLYYAILFTIFSLK